MLLRWDAYMGKDNKIPTSHKHLRDLGDTRSWQISSSTQGLPVVFKLIRDTYAFMASGRWSNGLTRVYIMNIFFPVCKILRLGLCMLGLV